MHRSGAAASHVILILLLLIGTNALSFWAGTSISDRPRAPLEDDNPRLPVYGFVQIEPRRNAQLLGGGKDEPPNYQSVEIEQRTHAAMLMSRTLLQSVISGGASEIRNTEWFKSFDNPIKARQWLEEHFHARPIRDSRLIKVWLDPIKSKREARNIVTAIVNAHLEDERRRINERSLDRTQALTSLRTKYEIRIRELSDKQNNLMLRLNMGAVGSAGRYTSTDLELQSAIAQRTSADAAVASARAEHELLAATLKDGDAALSSAQMTMQKADAVAGAARDRIEQLKGVLGDMAIAMSDYLSIQDELVLTRAAAKDVRDQLDTISAQNVQLGIDWAQRPAAFDAD